MKIGRNDPCPCGSGKKYKKCCLDRPTPSPAFASSPAETASELVPKKSFLACHKKNFSNLS